MMKMQAKQIKFFSLVELMVAVAILIVMMGFLFQFTIGAQRIWSASNANAGSFEDANIVFQFLEDDLKNIILRDQKTNPQRGIPFFLSKNSGNVVCAFMTSTRSNSPRNNSDETNTGAYYVVYYYNSTSKQLSRLVWDSDISTTVKTFHLIGADVSSLNEAAMRSDFETLISNSADNEILCKNMEDFDIAITPNSLTSGFAGKQFSALKVSFVLQVESSGDTVQQDENRRGFSKLVFLPEAD